MHPVTASLLNSVGGAGGRSCGWGRSKKIGVGQNKLWIENFIDNTQAAHANQAIYQTRLLQIKSQAVVNNPLARKNIFKRSISIFTKIIHMLRERWQLDFVSLNGNLAVNLKPTHPPLLNDKGQFTFLKKKLSHSSGIWIWLSWKLIVFGKL